MPPLARRYGLRISLSFGLAIVFSPPVFAQDCSETAIDQSIQQIATPEAQDALQICGEVTIAPLLKVLNRGSAPEQRSAIVVLGRLGADAADAVDPLLAVILAPDETEDVRREAIAAVADITQDLADQAGDLNPWDRDAVDGVVSLSEQLAGILNGAVIPEREAFPAELRDLNAAQRQITIAAQKLTDQPEYQLSRWIVENPWIWLVVVYGGGYGFIFWLKPLWLLNLAEFQESVLENIPESIPLLRPGITALLGAILPGKYAPRILDAWVAAQLAAEAGQESAVKRRFESIATVQDRQNRVWLPVKVNGDTKTDPRDFSPETLKPFFSEAIVGIWIDGEGGSGKTSLAFEIAHWALAGNLTPYRILPVLIEDEPRDDEELLTVIRLRLEALVGEKASLDETLLRNLLREKRILVIVDHISEMSEGTQKKIKPRNQDVQINALLVTARYVPYTLNDLWTSCGLKLNPMLLGGEGGEGLYRFVQDYLGKRGAQNLLGKGEDFEVCSGLTRMAANRNITALLATLYIDQLLGWENGEEGDLPESTPILMLTYVNKLNRAIADRTEPWKANWAVQRDLQAVAWCCVQNAFYPANAPRQKVLDQLEQIEADTAPARLTYLVQRLNLVRVYEDGSFRVSLDPLAEYLAALHLIADLAADEQRWRELLQRLDATVENSEDPGAATAENRSNLFQAVRGFLLALRDCCQDKERQHPVPDWLVKALGERAGLDEATLLAEQQRYRLKRLMGDLSVPEPEDRARAAQELGKLGAVARKATARLRKVLNNTSEVAKVRREAGKALLQVGEAIPLMVVEFQDGQEQLHLLEHPPQRIVTLPNNVPLELVEIPAGEFLMGDDNDSSASPRHRVQIPHSFWMGKYPITQAQWQAVAELPQVEQELDPDPSAFKGEHHPVEMVSWYEAEEFCRRLSQYSGETFDLPTEAEWEYAARGGTTTDYHFGDEMIMELANYDGPNAVDQTTPVGDYGVANRFGLLDIHGNVWEWCLDHWHKNYEEKPEELKQNGSTSWLTSDEAESRLLRGGSWGLNAENCRSAYRTDFSLVYRVDLIGFRVVCRSSRTR